MYICRKNSKNCETLYNINYFEGSKGYHAIKKGIFTLITFECLPILKYVIDSVSSSSAYSYYKDFTISRQDLLVIKASKIDIYSHPFVDNVAIKTQYFHVVIHNCY